MEGFENFIEEDLLEETNQGVIGFDEEDDDGVIEDSFDDIDDF